MQCVWRVAPVANRKWTEEQKAKALTIAEAVSIVEAAKETGTPTGTIKSWRYRANHMQPMQRNHPPKKLERLAKQAAQEAATEAKDYIVELLKPLADDLYRLAKEGLHETRVFMAQSKAKDHDSAAWLRSVVGAMHYGILDAQLLSGKATVRPEVINRHEYDITEHIITAHPELLEVIFPGNQQRDVANRGGPGARPGMGEVH